MSKPEGFLVACDIGTSKICVLIGEQGASGALDVIGKGACANRGTRKGNIINVDATIEAIKRAAEEGLVDPAVLESEIVARDRQFESGFGKDAQVTGIYGARRYRVDRLIRVAKPHPLLDPEAGPLIAVRLWILTRKTLGGLLTDLSGRVLTPAGEPFPGLYAAGEVAGFGGGGMHGYRSLEGTFLGGCLFSGRVAGRAAAAAVA
jgi:predicted oxidoreductase